MLSNRQSGDKCAGRARKSNHDHTRQQRENRRRLSHSPGIAVTVFPVIIPQSRDHHALLGRDVQKLLIFNIDTDVSELVAGFEKHQITGFQLIARNRLPKPRLLSRGTRYRDTELVPKRQIRQTRAINTTPTHATVLVRRPFPLFVLTVKHIDNPFRVDNRM